MEEIKTIRFKKSHTLRLSGREVRFKQDDTLKVGQGSEGEAVIDEPTARDLIARGIALPGLQHGSGVVNRLVK